MLPAKQAILLKPWLFRPFINCSQRGPLRWAKIPSMQDILNWNCSQQPRDSLWIASSLTACRQSAFRVSCAIKKKKKLFSNSRMAAEDSRYPKRKARYFPRRTGGQIQRAIPSGRAPDCSLSEGKIEDTTQLASYPCHSCGKSHKAQFAKALRT